MTTINSLGEVYPHPIYYVFAIYYYNIGGNNKT